MAGAELAESGDRDGSARSAAGTAGGGAGVREEGLGDRDGSAKSASRLDGANHRVEPDGDQDDLDEGELDDGELDDRELDAGELDTGEFVDDEHRVRPFWARTSALVVFVVVLFVLSGAVTAWLRISDLQDQVSALEAQTLATEDARQVATMMAQDLATYDYRDLGGNFRHVRDAATSHFAGQLRQLTEELGPQLQQTRAVATATVRSAGVVRADTTKAVVAVFVDQTVTNTKTPEPRTERSRMELTLVKQDGVWRLDQAGEL